MHWPCSLWFRCFRMNYGERGLPMTLLRLESFSLFVDGATFPMQGNHGLWRSRSICLKLKRCLADLGVCRSWSADNFLQASATWEGRLAVQTLFEGIWRGWFKSGWNILSVYLRKSVNPTQRVQLLSTASQKNGATFSEWFMQSNLPLLGSPVEKALGNKFLPALTGQSALSLDTRRLLALPSRLGGLGIRDPGTTSAARAPNIEYRKNPDWGDMQQCDWTFQAASRAKSAQAAICKEKEVLEALRSSGNISSRRLDHLQQKGTSSWLTATPVDDRDLVT